MIEGPAKMLVEALKPLVEQNQGKADPVYNIVKNAFKWLTKKETREVMNLISGTMSRRSTQRKTDHENEEDELAGRRSQEGSQPNKPATNTPDGKSSQNDVETWEPITFAIQPERKERQGARRGQNE